MVNNNSHNYYNKWKDNVVNLSQDLPYVGITYILINADFDKCFGKASSDWVDGLLDFR